MPCYRPIPAYQSEPRAPPKLWPPMGTENLALPCGKCIGCRTTRALQWADRCTHETKYHRHNTFITLTYADEHLPQEGHLDAAELQRFFKRLRKRALLDGHRISSEHGRIRYFACGEYGEKYERPHYHAILFGCDFTDKYRVGKAKNGEDLYASDILRELWPWGQNTLGRASPASANYIAQYSLKKIGSGDYDADGVWRPAPFLRMSLKPAIGAEWLKDNANDLRKGFYTQDARPRKVPRTYVEKLKKTQPELAEDIQYNAYKNNLGKGDQNLAVAEIIHHRRKELTEKRTL